MEGCIPSKLLPWYLHGLGHLYGIGGEEGAPVLSAVIALSLIHIFLAGRAVKQGYRRLAQYKGIFSESLVVLRPNISLRLLRTIKEFRGKDLYACLLYTSRCV